MLMLIFASLEAWSGRRVGFRGKSETDEPLEDVECLRRLGGRSKVRTVPGRKSTTSLKEPYAYEKIFFRVGKGFID